MPDPRALWVFVPVLAFAVVVIAHLAVNVIGYAIGARREWL